VTLSRAAFRSAAAASAAIGVVGAVSGTVRLLPWVLDPAVPLLVAAPFARGLAAVTLEAAMLLGWPIGWAVACFRSAEVGEARVLLSLGEAPLFTVSKLAPQGAVFAVVLAAVGLVYGGDANAPGRVATALIAQARTSCQAVRRTSTYAIPFTGLTWLCAADRPPRLVGSSPGGLTGTVMTAAEARIAGDFRALELADAHVFVPGPPPIALHARTLALRGLAPWARASTLPAALRAAMVAMGAWASASIAAYGALQRAARTRLGAVALGASGPLAALALLRLIERADVGAPALLALPLAASVCSFACSTVLRGLRCLRRRRPTASK
jgi:hypothetical protein